MNKTIRQGNPMCSMYECIIYEKSQMRSCHLYNENNNESQIESENISYKNIKRTE